MFVGGSALAAMLATLYIRRQIPEEIHQANNEVAGFIFAAVAVVYGVMLAFLVLVAWQAYQDASATVESEANTLVNIYRLGQEIDPPFGAPLRAAAISYARQVVDDEWHRMGNGEESAAARDALEALWRVHRDMDAANVAETSHQDYLFTSLQSLGNERRIRLLAARSELPLLMWLLLWGGAAVTLGFTLFFRAPNARAHLLMAGMFAGLIGFVLFMILELDTPFTGSVGIEPTAFQQALDMFQRLGP